MIKPEFFNPMSAIKDRSGHGAVIGGNLWLTDSAPPASGSL